MNKNYLVGGLLVGLGIYLYMNNKKKGVQSALMSNASGCGCSNANGSEDEPFWTNDKGWGGVTIN